MSFPSYRKLPTASSIRLLNIKPSDDPQDQLVCALSLLDMKDEIGYSGYSAGSYEWGKDEPTHSIILNGHPILVRKNLHDFLIQVRSNGWYSNLWVDALCINQDDIAERNVQVGMMSAIYSRACHVLVWLGKLSESTIRILSKLDNEIDELLRYQMLGWRKNEWEKFQYEDFRDGMRALVRNSYWKRKWIIQEIGLSGPNASLVFRGRTIPLDRVRTFMFEAQNFMNHDNWYKSDLRPFSDLIRGPESMTCKSRPLSMLLDLFSANECTEPKDHIYALLSLTKEYEIKIDYARDITEDYWEVLKLLHQEKEASHHLRLFSRNLQFMLGISDDQVLESWAKIAKEDCISDLVGYQFIEAIQMIFGEFNEPNMKQHAVPKSLRIAAMPSFSIDYSELHLARRVSSAQDDALALFRHVFKHHQSTLDDSAQELHFGPCLGDYFIGIVAGSGQRLTYNYGSQTKAYDQGTRLIPFQLNDLPIKCNISPIIDFSRRSDLRHMYLESARNTGNKHELVPTLSGDIICVFSGHQSALVVRRTSDEDAVCGTAMIKMKPASSLERLQRRKKEFADRMRGIDKRESAHPVQIQPNYWMPVESEDERETPYTKKIDRVFTNQEPQQSCSVRVFFKPHCTIKVSNWTSNIRRPFKPYLNHCRCKPGEGGCR